jgi:hypothetical protein
MTDERTAETPPGTPGQRALGAMESAVRRARASAGAPPLAPPPLPGGRGPARREDVAPPADAGRPPAPPREPRPPAPPGEVAPLPSRPDRWLLPTVVTVAVLVVAATIALIVSLTGSSAPPSSTAAGSGPATTVPSHSPSAHPPDGGAPATTPSSTTTVAVAPAGPPVISSLSPASGSAGQSVTVSGANFLSATGQIVATFDGQVAPTSCPAQNTCTVTVPPSNAPSAQVVITTAGGASNAQTFTYS